MASCYMCHADPVTLEHVPPLCLFPEPKDLSPGEDMRRNLITVPSCEAHNLRKSGDDEYLLVVLVAGISANAAARKQVSTKLMRAFKKRPSKYGMFGKVYEIRLFGQQTGMFFVNRSRFDNSIQSVARGLFYHHYGATWTDPILVFSPAFLISSGPNPLDAGRALQAIDMLTSTFLASQSVHGDNPEVFTYQLTPLGDREGLIVRMVFYGGIRITAVSHPRLTAQASDA